MAIHKTILYIKNHLKRLGNNVIYAALLLFYAYQDENTSTWAKRIILGALAYFLSPIDGIPDLTPLLGFTDDLGLLSLALVNIACYINDDTKVKAKRKLSELVGTFDEEEIKSVDAIF